MTSPDHTLGHLYEQVLELAKREIDEAAGQMEELKRSIQLLEARVEAAKSIYESVAARLNLEDEGETGYASAYQEPPKEVPEPPEPSATVVAPPAETLVEPPTAAPETPAPTPTPESAPVEEAPAYDLSLIRQHLAQKLDGNGSAAEAPTSAPQQEVVAPAPAPPADEGASDEKDAFSMELIRRHLAEKAESGGPAGEPAAAAPTPPTPPVESAEEPAAPAPASAQGGLSDADRELIGAYLRSKQS
tara:strand:- start:2977 stop:3714 length:738 start_codon:yes stop_codon:yes gene_type:complete